METSTLIYRVARRFLEADDRYRIPAQYKHILQMVDEGVLDPKVLLAWKYVVEKMGPKFSYGGAVKYWQNKCKKLGHELPAGPDVRAQYGAFQVKSGDEIEDWIKEYLRSQNLINDTQKTAAEWQLEIEHLERTIEDAEERIKKHEDAIARGSKDKRREKWLESARKDLNMAGKEIVKARKAVEELSNTIEKHEEVEAPVIDFEKQFQMLLHQASNDLAKKEVLAQAKRALARFEEEMSNPKIATDKQGVDIWNMLVRTWDKLWGAVKKAFSAVADWTSDLMSDTKQLKKLLASV